MILTTSIDFQKIILDLELLKQEYYHTTKKVFLNFLENLYGMVKEMLNFAININ